MKNDLYGRRTLMSVQMTTLRTVQMAALMTVLFCMMPFMLLTAAGVQYDTRCGVCGYDNPQWLEEDTVHYCDNCGALGYPAIIAPDTGAGETATDDTDNYESPPYESVDDEEIPFELVVGGTAAVLVVAAAMAKAKQKKDSGTNTARRTPPASGQSAGPIPPHQRNKPRKEQPAGYIIQMTQDMIVLADGEEAVVGIRVLRVADNGQTSVASNAEIFLQTHQASRLILMPNRGMGVVNVKISLNGAVSQDGQEMVQVSASVQGKMIVAMLTVSLKTGWKMVFR